MTESSKPTIRLSANGPLLVEGLQRFANSRGEPIETKKMVALCRCGGSSNKPFCDGTHARIGFTDNKQADRTPDKLETYEGKGIAILDNRGTCSHAGECSRGLAAVWRSSVEPWIDPDGAPPQAVIDVVKRCPSGALAYLLDGKVHDAYHDTPEIQISRDGPYQVRGGIVLEGAPKCEGASDEHFVLCRCGQSRNKPFCDGSHWYAGFKDDELRTIAQANRATTDAQDKWIAVGKVDDYAVDSVSAVAIGERTLALVRTASGFQALDGRCPHLGGPLTEGAICDGKLRCPWHGFDFDLKNGKGCGHEFDAETFELREQNGNVEILVPQPKRSSWTVSHVMAETLVQWGVDTVFGMVGHSNLGLAEALRVQEERGKLRYVGIRHEGAAAFACSGYAKVSGRPAACLSIAGPGATNLLTGLWDAKVDRAPVLALTGQVNTQVLGPGAFQEIDLRSAFDAVARFSQTVLHDSNHAELAALALKTAIVERDVAHLIFPDEVQVLDAGDAGPVRREGRVSATTIVPSESMLSYSLHRLGHARRPAIIVGYGARDAMPEVIKLAEALNAPVITTFKAKGQISDHHPHGAGVLGRSGTPVASWFMNEADLLLVFGASFSAHTGITRTKPIIQVDFDRMALGKFHPVDEAVWGDIGLTATLMLERAARNNKRVDQRAELAERWASWRADKAEREQQDTGNGINSAIIFRHLANLVPDDAVIAVDVGSNTYSFGRYFECKQQSVLMSGYLGSIGFAFPAAMGAWAAVAPARKVVSISGDGGFGQYMGEFLTAVKYGMTITHVLLNNSELGKISKEQRDGEWKVWQTSLHNPNFAEYARSCGGAGFRVEKASNLEAALKEALAVDGPSLVEVITDPLLT